MAERTEDFYVPLRDKIMGVICIIGVIASIILLSLVCVENGKIKAEIPDDVNTVIGQVQIYYNTSSGESVYYQNSDTRVNQLNNAGMSAIISLITLIIACLMLLFPKFMYMLDTLKYRLFYNWDTTPSYFAIVMRKITTYVLFTGGVIVVIHGYIVYF